MRRGNRQACPYQSLLHRHLFRQSQRTQQRVNVVGNSYSRCFGILLICFCTASALTCKSIPIQEKEAAAIVALDKTKSAIQNNPNLTPKEKDEATQAVDNAQKMIREQGQTITECDADLESAKKYRLWFFLENAGLAVLGLLWWKFKS